MSLFLLEVIFSSKEYTLVKQSAPGFRPGWLQDKVIPAYLYNTRQKHLNIHPSEALALNKFKKLPNLSAQVDSNEIEYICIPYNDSGMHWILAVRCVKTATILALDPMVNEYQTFNKTHQGAVYAATEILNYQFQKQVEKVEPIKHSLQKDTNSCGVYCCFYSSQVLSSKCKCVPANINTVKNMPEYGFSLTRIFPHKGRIIESMILSLYGKIRVSEHLHSGMFYAVTMKFWRSIKTMLSVSLVIKYFKRMVLKSLHINH